MEDNYVDTLSGNYKIRIPKKMGRYVYDRVVGSGSFAVVCKAHDEKTRHQVAIKVVSRHGITESGVFDRFESEVRILERLDHPNIAKIYEVIYLEDVIMVVMEYGKNGDMFDYISNKVQMPEKEVYRISLEILDAIVYLHKRGIAHRDIKPENIVFDARMRPKLIDFGFCKESNSLLKTICGTPYFIPPEMFSRSTYDGLKGDIWSYGVTVHGFATGALPWEPLSEAQYLKAVKEQKIKLIIAATGKLKDVCEKSLIMNPAERATAEQLLALLNPSSTSSTDVQKFMGLANSRMVQTDISMKNLKATGGPNTCLSLRDSALKMLKKPIIVRPKEAIPPTTSSDQLVRRRINFH